MGQMNENGELLAELCAIKSLVIGGTFLPNKTVIKVHEGPQLGMFKTR